MCEAFDGILRRLDATLPQIKLRHGGIGEQVCCEAAHHDATLIENHAAVADRERLSGALLTLDGAMGLQGLQWLVIVEGLPATLLGIACLSRYRAVSDLLDASGLSRAGAGPFRGRHSGGQFHLLAALGRAPGVCYRAMSGSGATCFALYDTLEQARTVAAALPAGLWWHAGRFVGG